MFHFQGERTDEKINQDIRREHDKVWRAKGFKRFPTSRFVLATPPSFSPVTDEFQKVGEIQDSLLEGCFWLSTRA